jgi:CO/xanthine dehydrogenase Mo-binding subunit
VPVIGVTLIDRPDQPIFGAGEATTLVMAPAIANAIFAQTGVRLRNVPFTPDAVKAALSRT